MIVKLIVASGRSAGRAIAIKRNTLLIGRAEQCDVRPLSEEVSRRHCQVTVGPDAVWVEDLGSRNGTHVNGQRIGERTKVVDGDMIRVGSLELKVSCTTAATTPAGSEEDVSRWLMTDDSPAGMSDTTRSQHQPDAADSTDALDTSSIHAPGRQPAASSAAEGSFVSGIGATPADAGGSSTDSARSTGSMAIEALRAAKSKPSGLPEGSKKAAGHDSSRDAAADALKKFFEKK